MCYRGQVACLPREPELIVVDTEEALRLPFRITPLALERIEVSIALVVREQRRVLVRAVRDDIHAEVDRTLEYRERLVERQVDIETTCCLRIAIDEATIDEVEERRIRVGRIGSSARNAIAERAVARDRGIAIVHDELGARRDNRIADIDLVIRRAQRQLERVRERLIPRETRRPGVRFLGIQRQRTAASGFHTVGVEAVVLRYRRIHAVRQAVRQDLRLASVVVRDVVARNRIQRLLGNQAGIEDARESRLGPQVQLAQVGRAERRAVGRAEQQRISRTPAQFSGPGPVFAVDLVIRQARRQVDVQLLEAWRSGEDRYFHFGEEFGDVHVTYRAAVREETPQKPFAGDCIGQRVDLVLAVLGADAESDRTGRDLEDVARRVSRNDRLLVLRVEVAVVEQVVALGLRCEVAGKGTRADRVQRRRKQVDWHTAGCGVGLEFVECQACPVSDCSRIIEFAGRVGQRIDAHRRVETVCTDTRAGGRTG